MNGRVMNADTSLCQSTQIRVVTAWMGACSNRKKGVRTMPTLEEAIEHAEDIAISAIGCECREEHRQLAEWLRELQERRKAPEIIFCKNCTRRKKNTETGEYYCRASGLRNTDYDFCSGGKRVERRTDG